MRDRMQRAIPVGDAGGGVLDRYAHHVSVFLWLIFSLVGGILFFLSHRLSISATRIYGRKHHVNPAATVTNDSLALMHDKILMNVTNEMEWFSSDAIIKLAKRTKFHRWICLNVHTNNCVHASASITTTLSLLTLIGCRASSKCGVVKVFKCLCDQEILIEEMKEKVQKWIDKVARTWKLHKRNLWFLLDKQLGGVSPLALVASLHHLQSLRNGLSICILTCYQWVEDLSRSTEILGRWISVECFVAQLNKLLTTHYGNSAWVWESICKPQWN